MYYVTMTDRSMSGWGHAHRKINKLVFVCSNHLEAVIVAANAGYRSDMKYINIRSTKPYYNKDCYLVQFKTIEEYPRWYQKDYFKK